MRSSSTVTVRLQVSGQSSVQTLACSVSDMAEFLFGGVTGWLDQCVVMAEAGAHDLGQGHVLTGNGAAGADAIQRGVAGGGGWRAVGHVTCGAEDHAAEADDA